MKPRHGYLILICRKFLQFKMPLQLLFIKVVPEAAFRVHVDLGADGLFSTILIVVGSFYLNRYIQILGYLYVQFPPLLSG